MKVQEIKKKGLKRTLSIIVDKSEIKKKLDDRLVELQDKIDLKGFRKGKVPPSVIKSQFGKSIYGEVIDKILKESTTKAIQDKKLKIAVQPKIDLKTFGEGKDLNFTLELDLLPEVKLQSFEKYKVSDYSVIIGKEVLDERLTNLTEEYKSFEDKKTDIKSELGDQVIFNYQATVDGKEFEGGKGENVAIELGKDLFLQGFDKQLVGLKKMKRKKSHLFYHKTIQRKNLLIKKQFLNVRF